MKEHPNDTTLLEPRSLRCLVPGGSLRHPVAPRSRRALELKHLETQSPDDASITFRV